jgi:6-pyruvoyltetrahydropterin/6-carboxytetrahydropterin synthase
MPREHEGAPDPPLHVFCFAPLAQRRNVGAENRATYGKCNNPYGHGHNYMVEVTVSGPVDDQTGMVCNLVDLDGFVRDQILERYDHQNLNLLPEFRQRVPTTENLCISIYEIVKRGFKAHLEKVRIEETMMNSFEYSGEER